MRARELPFFGPSLTPSAGWERHIELPYLWMRICKEVCAHYLLCSLTLYSLMLSWRLRLRLRLALLLAAQAARAPASKRCSLVNNLRCSHIKATTFHFLCTLHSCSQE